MDDWSECATWLQYRCSKTDQAAAFGRLVPSFHHQSFLKFFSKSRRYQQISSFTFLSEWRRRYPAGLPLLELCLSLWSCWGKSIFFPFLSLFPISIFLYNQMKNRLRHWFLWYAYLCIRSPCLDFENLPQRSQGMEISVIWLASMWFIICDMPPSFLHTLHILPFPYHFHYWLTSPSLTSLVDPNLQRQ